MTALTQAALAIYIACFSIGAFNHARDFAAFGWRPYQGVALPIEAFWSALILLDLSVVALLCAGRRNLGLALAAAAMLADVGVNAYALIGLGISALAVPLVLQALFLGFVFGSIGFLWRTGHQGRRDATM